MFISAKRSSVINWHILVLRNMNFFYTFRRKLDFWKLDKWEDDSRRRRRLIKDPNGHSHSDAVFHAMAEGVCDAFVMLLTLNLGARWSSG